MTDFTLDDTAKIILLYNFPECYSTWLRNCIYAVINMSLNVLMHIQVFVPAKAPFFLKGIQQIDF